MQTHKKLKARVLSLALSVAMVTTMMPMNVFAAEGGTAPGTSSVGTIQSFDKLEDRFIPSTGKDAPDHVYGLTVELDTPVEELNLPDELTAMVARTVTAPAEDEPVVDSGKEDAPAEDETIPDENKVATDDTAADDTVSGNQPASPSDAKEEVKEEIKDEDVPLAPEWSDKEITGTTTRSESIPVEWNSDKEYRSDENGKFIYTAVLPEDYILADGVKLPQIVVTVETQTACANIAASNAMLDKLLALLADQQAIIDNGGADVLDGEEFKALVAEINALYAHVDGCETCKAQIAEGGAYNQKLYGMQTLESNLAPSVGSDYMRNSCVFGNGVALVIEGENDGTTIYIDANENGVKDSGEQSLKTANITGAPADGADLSEWYVLGGTESTALTGDTHITMNGGKVDAIIGGCNDANMTGDSNITVNEGEVAWQVMGGNLYTGTLKGDVFLTIKGGSIRAVNLTSPREVTVVSGNATVKVSGGTFSSSGILVAGAISGTKTAVISGGTIPKIESGVGITVTNNDSAELELYTFTVSSAPSGTKIKTISLTENYSYGVSGITLDSSSKFYVWLPKSGKTFTAITVTTDSETYSGAIVNKSSTLEKSSVTGVTVTPSETSIAKGGTKQFSANVAGTNAPKTVTWTVSGNSQPGTSISATGLLTVDANEAENTSLTVTATSTFDTSKSGTATAKVVNKTPVTISGLSAATGLIYNGSAQNGYKGTISVEGNNVPVNELVYTYTSTDGGTYNSTTAPTNAGTYNLAVSVADSNANYTGAHADIPFTIGKATITITADNKSAYVGNAKPALTYTATGLASGDNLATVPALGYETEPDMSKAGSVKIKAKDAVVPNTDNYESAITYVDGTLTISTKSSGGGGSSSGSGSYTPPTTKPTEPVTGNSNTNATVDDKGNATVNVTDKNITDAVKAAKEAATKKGVNAGEVTAVINVTAPANSNPNTVTVNLPKTVQQQVISNKIGNLAIVIDKPDISIGMNLATITEMNKQANADIQLSATRTDATKLSTEAKNAIRSRPAFDLKATYASGAKSVTNFGSGSVTVAIPYTLQIGEVAGGLYAVYVDGNGKVNYITNSSYDAENKVLRFSTNHFSVYGIGYKAPVGFTDIASHWAKTDIEFVVSRGLMSGTSNTTFAPNSAMTRGMFVTALGRLAGVDVNSYKTAKFTDVKTDAYYAPYVNWAATKGIVKGTSDTTFAPDQSISRQEMAVMMSNYVKAMGYTVPETRDAVIFADNASIGSWAAPAVKQMQMAGILNSKNGNTFDPTGTATRGEISAMLHRYVSLIIDKVTTEGWTTNDSGSGMYYQNGKALVGAQTIGGVAYNFNNYGETTQKTNTAGTAVDAVLPASDKKYFLYTVKPGDWLSKIAISNHCTVEEIIALNGIKNKDLIVAGHQIKVPQK